MQKSQGFILAEIIIALLLVASIALLLVRQQWQNTQFVQQMQLRLLNLNNTINQYELAKRGFSLSEVLIALFLIGLLFTGLIEQYVQVYRQDISLQKKTQNMYDFQYLAELLRSSIRSAGFTPCANLDSLQSESLQGFELVDSGFIVKRMSAKYKSFKDIKIEISLPTSVFVNNFKQLLITDCNHAELLDFKVIKKSHQTTIIGLNNTPKFQYFAPIYIGEFLVEKFYLKNDDLYFKDVSANKLVSGVEKFTVDFKANNLVQINIALQDMHAQYLLTRIRSK